MCAFVYIFTHITHTHTHTHNTHTIGDSIARRGINGLQPLSFFIQLETIFLFNVIINTNTTIYNTSFAN